ncbi:unnamed protein product [Pelagomonas calceolata]|uniref:Uncharacterized protein n=1 Tax=Pelagomonas calceolata TaxID=35677 RepID=A0A8J2T1G6_9STRA|nr:unnamed protein product [Pelagomonas calceolata]
MGLHPPTPHGAVPPTGNERRRVGPAQGVAVVRMSADGGGIHVHEPYGPVVGACGDPWCIDPGGLGKGSHTGAGREPTRLTPGGDRALPDVPELERAVAEAHDDADAGVTRGRERPHVATERSHRGGAGSTPVPYPDGAVAAARRERVRSVPPRDRTAAIGMTIMLVHELRALAQVPTPDDAVVAGRGHGAVPAARDGSDASRVGDDRRHDGRPGLPIMKSKVAVVASDDDDAVRPGDVGGAALELHARVRRKRVRTQQIQRTDPVVAVQPGPRARERRPLHRGSRRHEGEAVDAPARWCSILMRKGRHLWLGCSYAWLLSTGAPCCSPRCDAFLCVLPAAEL